MRKSIILLAATASFSAATSAHAAINLLQNASFEDGIDLALTGNQKILAAGDLTSINFWRVGGAGVNYVQSPTWDAANLSRSVELFGKDSSISQKMFGFTVGKRYELSFNVSADPANPSLVNKDVEFGVSITGGNIDNDFYTFVPNVNSATNMLYSFQTYTFIASGKSQDIMFKSKGGKNIGFGPVIDAIRVSAVPEASTWAMLLAGFGLVGVASRRRKSSVVAA